MEAFACLFGLLAGVCTGLFDVYVLANAGVPLGQLNADVIYPIFFLLGFYAYLFNTRQLGAKPIFLGTTFFILLQAFGLAVIFVLTPFELIASRFAAMFPNMSLAATLMDISLARLTPVFVLMLITLGLARLLSTKSRPAA